MLLIDNINILQNKYKDVREELKRVEANIDKSAFKLENTKKNVPTLVFSSQDKSFYIHSKYDPIREAESFIDKLEDIENYKHVFFYGVGLGYHVGAFVKKYPNITFSLYEPNPEALYYYLSNENLNDLNTKKLKNIYIKRSTMDISRIVENFIDSINEEVLFITLPSYERIFKQDCLTFVDMFKKHIFNKKGNLHANAAYEKRWIINSIINFKETINTPNILSGKKSYFKDKPVLLVSAGPSLEDEIENIRHIKENGLAYVFSVGSAINGLIANGIYPDAMTTYDPSHLNQKVFEKVIEKEIDTIPLIFGSSVGFETLQRYKGLKMHMITSQDTVSDYYLRLKESENLEKINDAPSIAVITLQLLKKLGVNRVILVGQNLAYRNRKFYAESIKYDHGSFEVTEKETENLIRVKNVYGDEVYTSDGLNRIRKQLEVYIGLYDLEVINTTKDGAVIEGTIFKELDEVMEEMLKDKVVEKEWHVCDETEYDMDYLKEKYELMDKEFEEIKDINKKIINIFRKLDKMKENNDKKGINKILPKFDKLFKSYQNNKFFKVFIQPMSRVQYELLLNKVPEIRKQKHESDKAEIIIQEFGKFIHACQKDIKMILPIVQNVHYEIKNLIEKNESTIAEISEDKKILAIIPARGGSKGIKNKNIKNLVDKPLIGYTIEAAKKSKYIDRIIVTTDDTVIKEISETFGAEVPFIRPKELAQDDTPGIEPILHAVNWLEKNEEYRPDYVINLQPTSPLRISEDIDVAIEKLLNCDSESLVSVRESTEHPYWMKKVEKGLIKSFMELDIKNQNHRRQNLPKVYSLNGAIYLSTTKNLLSNKLFYSENTLAYIMPKERSIDIDDMIDFRLAEIIIKDSIS